MSRILFKRPRIREIPEYELISQLNSTTVADMERIFGGRPFAFDFETFGIDPTNPDCYVRSIGLANAERCTAIDLVGAYPYVIKRLFDWLVDQRGIAHNMIFDAAWIRRYAGVIPMKMECCTMGMFKQLSTEGWAGQTWGLKMAQEEILGWPEQNDQDLKEWLKENKLKKAEMAKAPWEILGPYNALDAAASFQLYEEFLRVTDRYDWGPALWDYHKKDFMSEIELLIESQFDGIDIDMESLEDLAESLDAQTSALHDEFMNHEECRPYIEYRIEEERKALVAKEPAKKFLKDTETPTKNWLKWKDKLSLEIPNPMNINSGPQLVDLFHCFLDYDVQELTGKGEPSVNKKCLPHLGPLGAILIKYRILRDQRKFVTSLGNYQRDGRIHPRFKVPGTLTGRLAGGIENG